MNTFDEMIGLPAEIQLGRRPLITLGEAEPTAKELPHSGAEAKESKFGDPNKGFISKLLSSKYGECHTPDPEGPAKRTSKPWQAD